MTHAPEPTSTRPNPAPDTAQASTEATDSIDVTESSAKRRAARELLAAIFITAGIAHLTHQRFYRSVLPYWLLNARRDLDVATGTVQVFGGVLLFMPKLRKVARWTNLAVLTPPLLAAIGDARHPARLRPTTEHRPGLDALGPVALAPGHAGLASLLWWATESEPAPRQLAVAR